MKRIASFAAAAGVMLAPLTAQALQSPALDAQNQAQAVLDRAVEAAGGLDALEGFRTARTTFSNRAATIGQGPRADTQPTLGDANRTVAHRSGGRLAIENFNGENLGFRYVRGAGPDWVYLAGPNAVAPVDPLAAVGVLDRTATSTDVLLELMDRSASMRYVGEVGRRGDRLHRIAYADPLGRQKSIYFDAQTNRLQRMELLSAHAQWGDLTTTVSFTDYRSVGGAQTAHGITTRDGEIVRAETTVEEIALGAEIDESLFTEPEDAGENPAISAPGTSPRELTTELLADGVFLIENAAQGYHVIAVELDDGVMVLETPQSPQTSRDVLRTLRAEIPSKPVRWAVPTHHHFDHSGGLYGYIEAGVSIITTEGNAQFVRDVGAAPREIGAFGTAPDRVDVQAFSGRRAFGDGDSRVELINVGPNPHVDEVIVAYFPGLKTLFVADLYTFPGTVNPANANALAFAERLEELDLDIETFIGVHGQRGSAEQFWDSVEQGRAQSDG